MDSKITIIWRLLTLFWLQNGAGSAMSYECMKNVQKFSWVEYLAIIFNRHSR
jgi:hypothetical protein